MVSMLSSGVDIKRGSPIQTLVLHLSTCQLPYPTSNILDSWGPRTELKIIVFHLSPSLKSDPVVVVGQVIFCLNKMISWYAVLTPQWWSEVWHDAGWVDGEIADIIIMIFILWQYTIILLGIFHAKLQHSNPITDKNGQIENITEMRKKFWYVAVIVLGYFIIKDKSRKICIHSWNCPKNRMFLFRAFDPIRCWH